MATFSTDQRQTYKLVEKLTTGKFATEFDLLKSLVEYIVNQDEFEITGGRIWELNPGDATYSLKYQYGNIDKIPEDYSFSVNEQAKVFSTLRKERVALSYETDKLLREKGIHLYSVTGVGEIIRTSAGKYYKYLMGFNAPEILQSFYETLSVISSVATVALRTMTSQAEKERISQDIISASEIQRNLLPDHKTRFHDFDIFGVCISDDAVGGDYFDYFKQSDNENDNLGIVVSDAASKGLPAAIQALFVSGAIRMAKRFMPKISNMMNALNNLVYETFPFERFVTLFYCELTVSSNRLVLYANAGHCPAIHYRCTTDEIRLLGSTGGLLGLMEDQKFGVENVRMHPGDILLLYTDGITEARNKTGAFFGEERLYELLRKYHNESPKNISAHILDELQRFSSDSVYSDDKTLVVIKRDISISQEN